MADQFTGAGGIYPSGSFYAGLAERLATVEETLGTSLGAVSAAEQAAAAAALANTAATAARETLDNVIANTANIAAEAAAAAEVRVEAATSAAVAASQASAAQAAAAAAAAGSFDPANYYSKTQMDAQLGTNGRRNLTISSDPPSGGAHGDIWYQV